MRFSTAAVAGFAAAAVATDSWGQYGHGAANTTSAAAVWTTEVVTAFTTYCPEATVITHGAKTYSVSSATTLTITGPVTITKPVSTSVVTVCTSCVIPSKPATWASVGTGSPYKPSNSTTTCTSAKGTGSWATPSATPTVVPAKGDASKASFGIAGLIAAFGLVAAL